MTWGQAFRRLLVMAGRPVEKWGQGFTTEAAAAVLDYAFKRLGLHKVVCTADVRNVASVRIMEKLGMKQEALLRKHRIHRDEYVDEVIYAVLAEDLKAGSDLTL